MLHNVKKQTNANYVFVNGGKRALKKTQKKDKESWYANAESIETNFHSQNLLRSEDCSDQNL